MFLQFYTFLDILLQIWSHHFINGQFSVSSNLQEFLHGLLGRCWKQTIEVGPSVLYIFQSLILTIIDRALQICDTSQIGHPPSNLHAL